MLRGVPSQKPEPITLLICDDHPTFGHGLAKLIEAEANDMTVVGVARNGEQAKTLVGELLPDIVLMDIRMPRSGGIEVTAGIKAVSPSTKIVMLTVSDDAGDLYRSLKAGASGYVLKDRELSEIIDAIRSVCRGYYAIPTDLAGRLMNDLDGFDRNVLSDQERDILVAIADGETNRRIASRLKVSERTVKRRVDDIYRKLHLSDRLEAAVYATRRGLGKEAENR